MDRQSLAILLVTPGRRHIKHNVIMEALISPLLPLFERERTAGRALALAVVAHTRGSTYRKPGALMLIASDGDYAGLLSGGCLESDLREHALRVIDTGRPHVVTYDTGGTDDALWGLGVGCEGAMRILLLRIGPDNGWQPLAGFAAAQADFRPATAAVVVASDRADLPMGTVLLPPQAPGYRPAPLDLHAKVQDLIQRARAGRRALLLEEPGLPHILAVPLALPPRLLVLGGGPDAQPLADIASRLAWRVTVYDHRPSYAVPAHFPGAERVVLGRPEELTAHLDPAHFDAAMVMSHHLTSDEQYLRLLAASAIPYVGLLGPVIRRDRLLGELGAAGLGLEGRLRSPVGLDLGGRQPASIALSIVAQIHAFLYGASGAHFGAPAA